MNQQQAYDVAVIGAGIVGLAVAERLQSQGRQVLLVERDSVAAGASQGNAAAFAFSDIMPLASPGAVKKAMKWLLDPLGPFAVVPQDLPWTLSWLLRFLQASRPRQVVRSIETQVTLMQLASQTMQQMLERAGMSEMVRNSGALHLYDSRKSYLNDAPNWELRTAHGIDFECLLDGALHHFQPGLSKHFNAGRFVPHWQTVTNPLAFCETLHRHLTEQGVTTCYAEVDAIQPGDGDVELLLAAGGSVRAGHVVVSAGPWSATLARQLGDRIPLIGERGYNTTFPRDALALDHMLVFSDHGFVVTPMADGIRIGGASEIARLQTAANYRRSAAMVDKAKRFLPELNTDNGEPWMGHRPSIPDTLPVIGVSRNSPRVVYAFGHGHLGLTQSAATGQLVSELIEGQTPSIDLSALSPDRF